MFLTNNLLTLLNGIEYCFNICGDITVILCLRNAGHVVASVGKKPVANLSKRRPCSGGIAYLK